MEVSIMTILAFISNTYSAKDGLPLVILIWLFVVILVVVIELLNLTKSFITDNQEHTPWMVWTVDRYPWKLFTSNEIHKDNYGAWDFWIVNWVFHTMVLFGCAMMLWPVSVASFLYLGAMLGLRWCCRLKKKVETINERCMKNHNIELPELDKDRSG